MKFQWKKLKEEQSWFYGKSGNWILGIVFIYKRDEFENGISGFFFSSSDTRQDWFFCCFCFSNRQQTIQRKTSRSGRGIEIIKRISFR